MRRPLQIVKKYTRTEKSSSRRRVARSDVGSGEPKVKEIAATLAPTTLKTFLNSSNRRGGKEGWQTERDEGHGGEAVAVAESKSVAKAHGECDGTGTGSGVGVERDLRSNWAG